MSIPPSKLSAQPSDQSNQIPTPPNNTEIPHINMHTNENRDTTSIQAVSSSLAALALSSAVDPSESSTSPDIPRPHPPIPIPAPSSFTTASNQSTNDSSCPVTFGSVPPSVELVRQGSAATFSTLHSTTSPALTSSAFGTGTGTGTGTGAGTPLRRAISANSMQLQKLQAVSHAIETGLHSTPQTPKTPSIATQDIREQKAILLSSLFQAIDHDSVSYRINTVAQKD